MEKCSDEKKKTEMNMYVHSVCKLNEIRLLKGNIFFQNEFCHLAVYVATFRTIFMFHSLICVVCEL